MNNAFLKKNKTLMKLYNFLCSNYSKSSLINDIQQILKEEKIDLIDLTNATTQHILLFSKLFIRKEDLFKNNIVILGGDDKFKYNINNDNNNNYQTLTFLIKGGLSSISTRKKPADKEFLFFCKRLKNMMFNISFDCLYCLENIENDFYSCNNCNSLICYVCFEKDFMKNGDTINIQNKECSICKTRGNYILTTEETSKEKINEKNQKLTIKKIISLF